MVTLCSCTIQFTESIASDDYESQADRNYHRQNPGGIVKAMAELLRYTFIQCVLLLLWMFIVGVRLFFLQNLHLPYVRGVLHLDRLLCCSHRYRHRPHRQCSHR